MIRTEQFLQNLKRFRLITFDVTDTLLRFRSTPTAQYAKTASEFGVKNIDKQYLAQCFRNEFRNMSKEHPNFGYSTPGLSWQQWWIQLVENIFRCIDPNIPSNDLRQIAEALLRIYRTKECWEYTDGSNELLEKIAATGKHVGVISNFDPSLSTVLREMEIDQKFHFILTSYDVGVQKPSKRIFEIPLERYNVKSHEALHIGNIYDIDYLGARNCGWSSLLVTNSVDNAKSSKIDHTYNNCSELLNALETSNIDW